MFGFHKINKPDKVIENELGTFTVKYIGDEPVYYSGQAVWSGKNNSILAFVYCVGNKKRVDKGFARLSELVGCSAELDDRLRKYSLDYAAENFSIGDGLIAFGDANAAAFTRLEFLERICVYSVEVSEDESVSFYVDLDEMFEENEFALSVDKDGNITGCELQV